MRGLAEVKLHPNSYVAYATLPNRVASDNPQASNGLFTQSLLKYMSVENTNLDTMIRYVRNDVQNVSGGRQTPYGINLLKEEFCFNGCPISYRSEKPKLDQFSQAFAQLEPLAVQGNINAQLELGNLFRDVNNSNYNINKAIYWYSKAANQGNGYAQQFLGLIHWSFTEEGVFPGAKTDDKLAFYWMLKSAQQNIPSAQGVVGGMYAFGVGVQKDFKKSLMWVKRAAMSGYKTAQVLLGDFYREGNIGLSKNYKEAFNWYQLAAKEGHITGQFKSAILLGEGGHGLNIDHKLSSYWYKQAATGGNASAQVILGYNYCSGLGVTKSLEQCASWLSRGYNNPFATQQEKNYAVSLWEEYNLEKITQ
jgi:TPR repeat protein